MSEPIFPGMDPFIEDQRWVEFHNAPITRIHNELARLLVPQYSVAAESMISVSARPDISVFFRGKPDSEPLERSTVAIAEASRIITPTIFDEDEQQRIEIRDEQGQLITVLEILSPANKTHHRDRYLAHRDTLLSSGIHLVQIDLLRGRERMEAGTAVEGYVILVARAQPSNPHRGELYEVGLHDPLPVILVPLKPGDSDVPLDLARLFRDAYRAARYRLQLDYRRLPAVPFSPSDQAWVTGLLG